MVLSVIIVNYRVRHFLELCLHSVQKALTGIGVSEIIVVDNNSGDGSVEALQPLFPGVRFVGNRENVGFAKANNQALALASGEYILFLNPDTILAEDFARVCLDFLQGKPGPGKQALAHAEEAVQHEPGHRQKGNAGPGRCGMGALGVRMVDGSGQFLPESRRGFPSPWVAFTRLSGLSALFPRSRTFAGYYLGHLPADRAHHAPVLSGACLLVRRGILDEVGGFDERFFMYAEDIDLSYRIEKAGYINYYFPGTTIVHFKGESTQKDIRYIRQFYKAMRQFRRKHFNRGLPALWNLVMEAGIWVRAGICGLGATAAPTPGAQMGPHDGRPDTVAPVSRIWVTGDPGEVDRVKNALKDPIAVDPETATLVLFCEGPAFSFGECITALVTGGFDQEGRRALFHAAGTHSAVGSSDRDGQGETRVF
jgi:N-acetylglucosaminyl-diphospho-decaprenol L-rhamnosyltransferase